MIFPVVGRAKSWDIAGPVLGVTALPASTGDIVPQKLSTAANSCLRDYLQDRCRQCRRGARFRPSPQGPGAATPNLTQIFNVFATTVWRSVAAKPEGV